MELVYLWVEDYKNIEKQGFNFSPRFKCEFKAEYDENGKLKSNCELEIEEKNDYVDIFPNNINVTAIVGENGSGKSSLVKLFFMLIFYKKYSNEPDNVHIELIEQKYKNSLFLILTDENGNLKKITYNGNINCNKQCDELDILDFFSVYFNYMADSWYDNFEDDWVNQIYHKTDNYKTPLLLQPNKQDTNTLANVINIDMITYLNSQRILQFFSEIDNYTPITNFFSPNTIQIKDTIKSVRYSRYGDDVEFKKVGKIAQQLIEVANKYHFKFNYEGQNKILNEIRYLESNNNFEYINQLYITFKVLLSNEILFDQKIFSRIKSICQKSIEEDTLISHDDLIQPKEFDILINKGVSEYEVLKLKKCFDFQLEGIGNKNKFISLYEDQSLDLNDNDTKELLNLIPPWLDIDFFEGEKSLTTLSSGEKILFAMIVNIMYQFKNINGENYNTINIFLDETELGLHPKWQKEYLFNILESIEPLNTANKKINFIFATHSPFILSDIPKQNILFLKNGLEEKVDVDTFGANIHTLLSHGFFMNDGLMGEFAKKRINNIIQQLNDKNYNPDLDEKQWLLKTIKIIGEDFLKSKLLDMYYKKFDDEYVKEQRKKELIEQQAKIQKELDSL